MEPRLWDQAVACCMLHVCQAGGLQDIMDRSQDRRGGSTVPPGLWEQAVACCSVLPQGGVCRPPLLPLLAVHAGACHCCHCWLSTDKQHCVG